MMIAPVTVILLILLAILAFAAVVLVIVAASTVGVSGLLALSGVPESVRLRAAPYRQWFFIILIAALVVCVLLVLIRIAFSAPVV
jgi:hypothetical protein